MTEMGKHCRPADPEYRRNYERGWRWAQRMPEQAFEVGGLNYADRKGYTSNAAWVDGYSDFAIGDGVDRAKWHGWHARRGTEPCECVQ